MNRKMEAFLDQLNPDQRKAVVAPDQPLLVLAGAGSGKTRILTYRIAHLIARGVPAFNILGVTFTNKAAGEMKKRVDRLVHQEVWVSTFHSTCLRILKIDGAAVGLRRNFSIYDDADQLIVIKDCMDELHMNERQINPKGVREAIQRAKDILMTPRAYAAQAQDLFEDTVAQIYERYEDSLQKQNACDFGDLIMKTVSLFDQNTRVLEAWQDRFKYILIDEYQDTNRAQYRFVKLLASRYQNITVVGDPDQSIYAWRGADIRNILDFENDYPACKVVKLEQNYRSTARILDASNALIEFNTFRKPKALWTEREAGEKITLFEAGDEREEAHFVAQKILEHQKRGGALSDCVVFYRVHAQSRALEDAFHRFKLPYRIVGGIRFYDRKEIKDLLAFLKVLVFPEDAVSFKRVINLPNRGIGKKSYEAFETYRRNRGISLRQALSETERISGLGGKAKSGFMEFWSMVQQLCADKDQSLVSELLEQILNDTGYLKMLELERTMESRVRIENIQEFFSVVREFEEAWVPRDKDEMSGLEGLKPENMLEAFLDRISLVTDIDTWDEGSNSCTLMTLHCAKGLEFPIVFMVGMEEELFPNVGSFDDSIDDLEEERRLCYVGMTRAKQKLYFVYANSRRLYGARRHNLPSRFLNEVPSEYYDQVTCLDTKLDFDETVEYEMEEVKRKILFD